MNDTATFAPVFDAALTPLAKSGDFAKVARTESGIRCDALHVEEDCYYAAHTDADGTVRVGWYSPDRWLSGSIEGDLVHTGDKIDELLEEELIDQGVSQKIKLDHYRDQDKVFVFHGKLEMPSDSALATTLIVNVLCALQACFIELGDMNPGEDE